MRTLEMVLVLLLAGGAAAQEGHGHGHGEGHGHGKGHGTGHSHGDDHTHGPAQALGALMPPYLRIQRALASDALADIPKAAAALAKAAHKHHMPELAALAEKLKGTALAEDRAAFRPISDGVAVAVLAHAPARKAYQVFDCAAAPGLWVQQGKEPKNPYQDGDLRTCGVAVEGPAAAPASAPDAPASAPASHPH
jgi:hypothetical protein